MSKSTNDYSNDPKISSNSLLDIDPTSVDEALEAVQNELIAEKDARREERFIWFAVLVIMFDALVFPGMGNWTAPLVIGVLQILLLIALGRKWGMDHIWTLTENIINKWDGRLK